MFLDEFEQIFKRMSNSFLSTEDIFEDFKRNSTGPGPFYYGYTMTIGLDGKPVVKEYGNIKPGLVLTSDVREPIVDTIVDEKERLVKLVAEIPGVEKADVKVTIQNKIADITANRGEKKYHVRVPVKYKIDESSAKATYKNGILEVGFGLLEDPKPQAKTVEVQ